MPQIQYFGTVGPSRSELQKEMLGESIGKGLSDFLNNYYANKALEGVESSKDYKNAPLSEKTSKLERALTPFGEVGLSTLQRRIGIEEQRQQQQENQAIKQQTGLDLSGIMDPQTRQQLIADHLGFGRKLKLAEATKGINPFSSGDQQNIQETLPEDKQGIVPKQKKSDIISLPGEQKRTELNPEQVWEKGQEIAQQYRDNNIPMDDQQGFDLANAMNIENINFNQRVEQQTEAYGNLGQEAITQVMPDASPELVSIFRRYGEDERTKASPAEARKVLAQKASQFKNKVSGIEKSIGPRRLFSGIIQDISGTGREEEKTRKSMREKLKFLHDLGLFDTERKLLSGLGYYPEEIESTITDLGENATKVVNQLPQIKKGTTETDKIKKAKSLSLGMGAGAGPSPGKLKEDVYSPQDLEKISSSIKSAISADPSVNLILLRKAYEKKGVDWSTFKDVLDDMVINGQIQLNPQQDLMFTDTLDQPPLTTLGWLLEKINLGGR